MFDIAFSELFVIMVVALIVIGPKQLPTLARTAGLLLGKVQRQIAEIKNDIEHDLKIAEIKELDAEVRQKFSTIESKVLEQVQEVKADIKTDTQSVVDVLGSKAT
jgi:sec-independent protein translocase protein TatB